MNSDLNRNDISPEQQIGKILEEKKWYMGTAESCTGGRIASTITRWPGSSGYYVGSIVSYSNQVKENILGVSPITLKEQGAVSQPVVEQMVQGAIRILNCDCAVATSGIAGPDGGTPEKPVGIIWIAAGTKNKIISQRFLFGINREENITKATETALQMLLTLLKEEQ